MISAGSENLAVGLAGQKMLGKVYSRPGERHKYGKRGTFGMSCLLARRLVERGVRVVQVYYGDNQPWDTHANNDASLRTLSGTSDRPIAAILDVLKQRGLLQDTLVLWGGEFGCTPASQGSNGRDHNHWGFSVCLAGGGIHGGVAHGATDEFGFRSAEQRLHVHDLHATMLYLLGIDHERLTYRYGGRDFRLTDVSGRVLTELLAYRRNSCRRTCNNLDRKSVVC